MQVTGEWLAEPVEYFIDFMDIANGQKFPDEIGMVVNVVKTATDTYGVPLGDAYNLTRLLGDSRSEIIGRGVLVEQVSVMWFVAWRPYAPAPEFRKLTKEEM